jgi:predicted phage terminase large subunit-like protein
MTDMEDSRRALRAALRADLLPFLQRAFRDIDPGKTLLVHPYLEYLSAVLMGVVNSEEKRLVINLPPRHLKSILASVVLPAFLLGRDPRLRIAVVSHSQSLARNLALPCRRLISSDWYREVFPDTKLLADNHGTGDFETSEHGGRYAASLDTGITGRGFDVIILDDPLSAKDARSSNARETLQANYYGMIASRLNDADKGKIIVVHQRLHEEDLSGVLLRKGGWRPVILPLIADEETTYEIGDWRWVRPQGDVLLPENFTPEAIRKIRAQGEGIFATQYQQNPSAMEGDLIKPAYIGWFPNLPPDARRITFSLDTAVETTDESSYSVCLVMARDARRHYVIDVFRARVGPVQLRDATLRLAAQYKPDKILIEKASSGTALEAMLKEYGIRSELIATGGQSKEERLESVQHYFVDRRVFVKSNEPWSEALIDEWVRFPFARRDDQVDAISQYLAWCQANAREPMYLASGGTLWDRQAAKHFESPPPKGQSPMRPRDGSRFRTGR